MLKSKNVFRFTLLNAPMYVFVVMSDINEQQHSRTLLKFVANKTFNIVLLLFQLVHLVAVYSQGWICETCSICTDQG